MRRVVVDLVEEVLMMEAVSEVEAVAEAEALDFDILAY